MDLSQIPAATPPSGVVPNFVDPASLAPICLIVIAITLPLMVIFLVLRVYVRFWVSHKTGADDVLCLISAALVITFCGITVSILDNPIGPHQWDVPVSRITPLFQRLTVASVVIYALGCLAVKSTLLTLYLRVFAPDPKARSMIMFGLIFIAVFYTISVIVSLATCLPHQGEGSWNLAATRCESQDEQFAEAQGVVGALTDLYVLYIPLRLLAGLTLSRRRKIALYAVFLTGLLACVVSIINATFRFIVFNNGDALWNEVPIYALCAAELNFGIMCACMPVVFIIFKDFAVTTLSWATKIRSWTSRGKSTTRIQSNSKFEDPQLPIAPKGTLNGLKSYIRRAYRSTLARSGVVPSQASDGELISYVSSDYNYHTHMVRPEAGATASLPPKQ
ncbi:hypothetical protein F5B22DRAFT_661947 [Xylaria bambusicola]|uniref:uncharacterized protein n=1 Tax=Xylaria bambusicola TaxID=326684 RepID=UPI002008408C|nr:uncharacterized protein F5B22DRAFT_661947 [Xylaria bambusicola]KAI0521604.1 hypothetical protein F5B22DRAFT_661947 [Xylaria bambusicola]